MGADGGLNWIEVLDSSKIERIYELIKPLNIIHDDLRDEDCEWMEQNSSPYECYLMSKYGTDMPNSGLEDLKDILEDDESKYEKYTFSEIIEDIYTRPAWQNDYIQNWQRDNIERLLIQYRIDLSTDISRLGVIKDMKVSDWKKELNKYLGSLYAVETWT